MRDLVHREGPDPSDPFVAGGVVTTYRLEEDYPFADLPPHQHDIARLNAFQPSVDEEGAWRVQRTIYCEKCPQKKGGARAIVYVWVHSPTATIWIDPAVEKRPNGVRQAEAGSRLMHGPTWRQPCPYGVASCPGCRSRWFVMSNERQIFLLAIKPGRYDAVVQE